MKTKSRRAKINHLLECLWCGEEFIASRKTKLWCSDRCRKQRDRLYEKLKRTQVKLIADAGVQQHGYEHKAKLQSIYDLLFKVPGSLEWKYSNIVEIIGEMAELMEKLPGDGVHTIAELYPELTNIVEASVNKCEDLAKEIDTDLSQRVREELSSRERGR